jgi:arabinan endo-1,5-alpha-L-arabinosidase
VAFAVNHGVIQIYIDGEIVYSGTGFPDVFKSDSSVFALGVNYWDPAFKGMIDELRVYDKALNKETIDLIFLEAKMPAPVAHFTFDGNLEDVAHGARAADIIGVERNEAESRYDFGPTFGNGMITYETGVQGQAASFNGESGVMLPAGLIQDNRYTVSLWLNPAQITRYTTTFFAALDGVNWVSFVPEGFQGDAMLWSNMNGTFYDGFTETTLPVNTWTHVAFTVDGGNVRVYINGELKHQGTNFNDVFTGKNPFYTLGVNWWDTPYQGLIDNLRIYDVPLTEEQVQVLYSLRR